MKKFLKFRLLPLLIISTMIISFNTPFVFAEINEKNITVLFTNDMHDHLLPVNMLQDGNIVNSGGYARLKSAVNDEKKKNPDALLLDAGDFSMGTLFQTLYRSDAPELRIMGQIGYDAVTLGNHEFDFRAAGLADTLNTARNSGDKLPQIVQSNTSFPTDEKGNLSKSLSYLKQAEDNYGVKDYTVIERSGVKIGIFGLIGKDAVSTAPMAEVRFTDEVENARRVVRILKEKEKADLIICLSHSGIWTDKSKSEDESLAKKVPEINVIISGHTHTKLAEPILTGKTIIVSSGEYCENLGALNISQDLNSNWKVDSYSLKQIDNSLTEDNQISEVINNFKNLVQKKYLDNFGMKYDEVLAKSSFNFEPVSEIMKNHKEARLGNLISDAYIYAVRNTEGADYEPVTAAIVPAGTIRGSFVKGGFTASDAFNASSLGIGADNIPGYPLISIYLTGKELKTACEVDASISPMLENAQLYISGVNFTFNPNRLIFNKVTKTSLQKADGTVETINDTKLYRVAAGLYSAQMLFLVGEKSHGLLSIVPKTKDGTPITDFEAQTIKERSSNTEVKEWFAVAEYLRSFDKEGGVSQVPEYYSETLSRKVVDNNHNPIALISNPNGIALAVYSIILAAAAIIILTTILITKRRKKVKDKTKAQM